MSTNGNLDREQWARLISVIYDRYAEECAHDFAMAHHFTDPTLCETQIETAFALAWKTRMHREFAWGADAGGYHFSHGRIFASQRDEVVDFDNMQIERWRIPPGKEGYRPQRDVYSVAGCVDLLDTQVPIGNHRADFVLQRIEHCFRRGKLYKSRRVVCECDGHEFHERTPERAQRDKARDRQMQTLGFSVLRFTGSELWRDPYSCVQQAIKCMDEDICRQCREDNLRT